MREALAWVTKLRSGDATKADLQALQEWRHRTPDHDEAFRQAARLWGDLKQVAGVIRATRQSNQPFQPRQWHVSRRALTGGALAATVAYLIYDPPLGLWPSFVELGADYRTRKGERRDVVIARDVSLTLNTLTSLSVISSDRQRPKLALIAGEAEFDVRRAPDRPLTVQAQNLRVVASGAAFTVRCIDGVVTVTCLNGAVDVEVGSDLVQLHSSQQVTATVTQGLAQLAYADPELATAWKNGLLIVRGRPLSEVVNEVNRYRSGRIIITNEDLARRLVNGTFHLDRLDNFPSQVQQLFGATVRALPGGIVFLS